MIRGFEKTAGIGKILGAGLGAPAAAVSKARKAVKGMVRGTKEEFTKTYEKHTRPGRTRGGALAKVRKLRKTEEASKSALKGAGKKVKPKDVDSAKGDVAARAAKIKAGKPGFAQKHPLATAGLAYGGMRLAFGGGSDKKDEPYVEVPRGY